MRTFQPTLAPGRMHKYREVVLFQLINKQYLDTTALHSINFQKNTVQR